MHMKISSIYIHTQFQRYLVWHLHEIQSPIGFGYAWGRSQGIPLLKLPTPTW